MHSKEKCLINLLFKCYSQKRIMAEISFWYLDEAVNPERFVSGK